MSWENDARNHWRRYYARSASPWAKVSYAADLLEFAVFDGIRFAFQMLLLIVVLIYGGAVMAAALMLEFVKWVLRVIGARV